MHRSNATVFTPKTAHLEIEIMTPSQAYVTQTDTAYLGVYLFHHDRGAADPTPKDQLFYLLGPERKWIKCPKGLTQVHEANKLFMDVCSVYNDDMDDWYGLVVDKDGNVTHRSLTARLVERCIYLGHEKDKHLATGPLNISAIRGMPPLPIN
jgi:hypothetical protein